MGFKKTGRSPVVGQPFSESERLVESQKQDEKKIDPMCPTGECKGVCNPEKHGL